MSDRPFQSTLSEALRKEALKKEASGLHISSKASTKLSTTVLARQTVTKRWDQLINVQAAIFITSYGSRPLARNTSKCSHDILLSHFSKPLRHLALVKQYQSSIRASHAH